MSLSGECEVESHVQVKDQVGVKFRVGLLRGSK